nr:MAG TPA: Nucleotide modification associated domain 1 [Caudoviricetes sp.]
MAKTYKAKNHDYGNSFDNTCDLFGITAAIVRMYDKMQRIITLSKTESYVKDERIEDTLLDLANYCIMTLMYLQNGKDK